MGPRAKGKKFVKARKWHRPALTQEGLAELLGATRSAIAAWETDRNGIPDKWVRVAASRMGIPLGWFYEDSDDPPPLAGPNYGALTAEATGKVKVYGGVGAGVANSATMDPSELDVPMQFARDDYGGMIVVGDSMLPLLAPGDIVIFRDWTEPKPGFIFAAQIAGGDHEGEWVIKELAVEGSRLVLRSLNPFHAPIEDPYRLAGFLVGIVHDEEPERFIRLNPFGIRA